MPAIDVYADIWCPFAHVGLRTVVRRRRELGRDDVVLRVHAWPLELVNGRPLSPETAASHVEELRRQVAPDLFEGFDVSAFPSTTLPALALAARAYRESDRRGEGMSLALRDAVFESGLDVSDPSVLNRVAETEGVGHAERLDEESVLEDWRHGQEIGVKGSPHFFCGGRNVFCPSLDIQRSETGDLTVRRRTEVLEAFLDGCFRDGEMVP